MGILKNTRHEKFCQNVASGMSQTQAYIEAGYNGTEEHIRKSASHLATKLDIKERLHELKAKTAEKAEISRSEILSDIKRAMMSCLDEENPENVSDKQNYLKAIDIINKMQGNYSEKKILEGGDRSIEHKIKIEFED